VTEIAEPKLANLPVNFHITAACNFKCEYCFATFDDVKKRPAPLSFEDRVRIIDIIADAGAAKLTISGGEPLLIDRLDELVSHAAERNLTTCIVTNGSYLSPDWFSRLSDSLSWLTLSMDSVDAEINSRIGRIGKKRIVVSEARCREIADLARKFGIGFKINTVVSKKNLSLCLAQTINNLQPTRWKIMQAMPVSGQTQRANEEWQIDENSFDEFVERHTELIDPEIKIVPEPCSIIRGSYLMIDPWGRLFDSCSGSHTYGASVLDEGLSGFEQGFDVTLMKERDGLWDWRRASRSTLGRSKLSAVSRSAFKYPNSPRHARSP